MAVSSNRSPSPISSRPRTPEAASSVRRSYSGNPFAKPSVLTNPKSFNPATPANSPSDFHGRNSGCVSSRVYDEKENEKENNNLKHSKTRSTPTGKGSKNFMSPTISAASKINPSPRKKVLAERNEHVRTSMSFSDVRSSSSSVNIADLSDDFEAKSEMGLDQNKGGNSIDETVTDFDESETLFKIQPVVSKPPKRVTFIGSEVIPGSPIDLESSLFTELEHSEPKPLVSNPPKQVTFLGSDLIIDSQIVSKPPKRVTFIGSEVIPGSPIDLESSLVTELEHSEPNPLVSNPPKQVTFLGSDLIIDSQIASETLPVTEVVENVESDLKEAVSETLLMSKPPKKVTFQEPSINIEPQAPLPGSSMSPIIAPLDADPSLPPYDPKTNYLSPRPQFLRYRPNPRIEVYLHKDKGLEMGEGKSLEESFMSDSLSDTEETGSEESSPKVSEEGSLSPSPSADLTTEDLEGDSLVAALNTSRTVEVKRELKQKFFTWRKIIGLLVVVLIASSSLSLTESPVFKASSYRDLGMSTFYNPSEINEFAGASFDMLVRGFKQVTTSCMSYLSRLSQIAAETGNLEPVQFANLTTLLENPFDDGYFKENHIAERPVEQVYAQEDDSENVEEIEGDGEPLEESLEETEAYTEAEGITIDDNLQESESIEVEEEGIEVSLEETEPYIEAEGESLIQLQSDEVVANSDFQDQSVTVESPEHVLEAKPEVVSSGDTEEHVEDLASGTEVQSSDAERNPERSSEMDAHDSEVDTSLPNLSGDNKLSESYKQVVLPLVVLALVIIATAIYFKRSQSGASRNEVIADSELTKKMNPENEERPEVDVMGESCPSEMSSFEKTTSYYSKRGYRETTANEAQSQERKQRKVSKRESLASSSSDISISHSYGSFTTYEKIPSKHGLQGYGEEEIVTPVRRSSRIKKVTSP